ncbi:Putative flippase GtrA (transmembrane translocase of bactoprenol-linked glucose) [Fibrobacter sp. UWP2]|nr:Putative flippase GtrA (transmembrane translocase of bactoprenol-linked glucose) [Fibrobacter sp. UWP2]
MWNLSLEVLPTKLYLLSSAYCLNSILVTVIHFIKYNIIGIMNTLITLLVVWVLHQWLDWNLELSNFLGFVAGGCNSYICNRIWNFKSNNQKRTEVVRFVVVFLCSYAINLLVLEGCAYLLLNAPWCANFSGRISQFMKPTYFANIIANVVYVLVSFTLYKKWVFKK